MKNINHLELETLSKCVDLTIRELSYKDYETSLDLDCEEELLKEAEKLRIKFTNFLHFKRGLWKEIKKDYSNLPNNSQLYDVAIKKKNGRFEIFNVSITCMDVIYYREKYGITHIIEILN